MSDDIRPPRDFEEPPRHGDIAPREVQRVEVRRIGDGEERFFPPPPEPRPPKQRIAIILFLLACASTFYVGMGMFTPAPDGYVDPRTGKRFTIPKENYETCQWEESFNPWQPLVPGLTYSICVMSILMAHEMGHYLQAVRYGVPATLPLFIPMPAGPIGTMGAVIFQQPGAGDRKAMFDIAISGPLAGLAVALPLIWWGLQHTTIALIPPGSGGFTNPLIVEWMAGWLGKPLHQGEDFAITPVLHAGWVGILVTSLNLIPIGQLDGGHLLYCLIGKRAHLVARALFMGAIAVIAFNVLRLRFEYVGWSLMLFLLWKMGTEHPPTADDHVPLGPVRIVLGWLTLAFILIGFVPAPMYDTPGQPPPLKVLPPVCSPRAVPERVQEVRITSRGIDFQEIKKGQDSRG